MRKKVFIKTTLTKPGNTCWYCGESMEAATSLAREPAHTKPTPGAVAVCKFCGALSKYTESLTLTQLTGRELHELQQDAFAWQMVEVARKTLKNKG